MVVSERFEQRSCGFWSRVRDTTWGEERRGRLDTRKEADEHLLRRCRRWDDDFGGCGGGHGSDTEFNLCWSIYRWAGGDEAALIRQKGGSIWHSQCW